MNKLITADVRLYACIQGYKLLQGADTSTQGP